MALALTKLRTLFTSQPQLLVFVATGRVIRLGVVALLGPSGLYLIIQ